MVTVKGTGKYYYGEAIGVILYDTLTPRIPGDVGNATTFDFPVRLKYVKGLDWKKVMKPDRPGVLPLLIKAAKELEKEGVKAITTSCGFTAVFQEELANAVNIPVFTSSLIQVPMVHRMLGDEKKVGIITANSRALSEEHFKGAGIDKSIPMAIVGIEEGEEWHRHGLESPKDIQTIDPEKVATEVVVAAKRLISENPDVGAIVLECTQLPSYALAVQKATGLPVFDIYTLTNMVYDALFRKPFNLCGYGTL